jgi:hypothetical protein
MHLHTIFLDILIKYALCTHLNTPSTYSTLVNINPNMSEFHQDISSYKLRT